MTLQLSSCTVNTYNIYINNSWPAVLQNWGHLSKISLEQSHCSSVSATIVYPLPATPNSSTWLACRCSSETAWRLPVHYGNYYQVWATDCLAGLSQLLILWRLPAQNVNHTPALRTTDCSIRLLHSLTARRLPAVIALSKKVAGKQKMLSQPNA